MVAEPIADAPFDKVVVFEEEPVIVSAAGLPPIGKNGNFPKTVLAFEHGCPHRKRLEDWYAKRGEMPERTIELGSYHAMLGCVAAGMGIALLPKSVLTTFPESKRLKRPSAAAGREPRRNRSDLAQGRRLAEHSGVAANSGARPPRSAKSARSQPGETQGVTARTPAKVFRGRPINQTLGLTVY